MCKREMNWCDSHKFTYWHAIDPTLILWERERERERRERERERERERGEKKDRNGRRSVSFWTASQHKNELQSVCLSDPTGQSIKSLHIHLVWVWELDSGGVWGVKSNRTWHLMNRTLMAWSDTCRFRSTINKQSQTKMQLHILYEHLALNPRLHLFVKKIF